MELTTGIISVPKWLAGQGMFWFVATRLTGQRHTQLIKLPLVFRTHKPVELCNRNVHFTTPQPYGKATTVTSQHHNTMEKQQLLLHNTATLSKRENHSIMPQQTTVINVTLSTLLLTTLTSGVFLSVCMAINFISPTFSGTYKKQTQN